MTEIRKIWENIKRCLGYAEGGGEKASHSQGIQSVDLLNSIYEKYTLDEIMQAMEEEEENEEKCLSGR